MIRFAAVACVILAAVASAAPPTLPKSEAVKRVDLAWPIYIIAQSSDGKSGACVYKGQSSVHSFNPHTGDIGEELFRADPSRLQFTPDGKFLLALGIDSVIWDVERAKPLDRITLPVVVSKPLYKLALPTYSPKDGRIYLRDAESNVVVRDFALKKDIGKLPTAGEIVLRVSVSPDGSTVAVVTDNAISFWDSRTFKRLHKIEHNHELLGVEFCADNKTALGYGLRKMLPGEKPGTPFFKHDLLLWDATKGTLERKVDVSKAVQHSMELTMSPDRNRAYLHILDPGLMVVIDPRTATVLGSVNARFAGRLCFLDNGKKFVSSHNRILYWGDMSAIHDAIGDKDWRSR